MKPVNEILDQSYNSIEDLVSEFSSVFGTAKASKCNIAFHGRSQSYYFKNGDIRLSDHKLPSDYAQDFSRDYRIIWNQDRIADRLIRLAGLEMFREIIDEVPVSFSVERVK